MNQKNVSKKVVLITFLSMIFLFIIIAIIGSNESKLSTKSISSSIPTQNTTVAEPFKITVTSQIVKNVNGKYRYFFDIRNNDKKDFIGKVVITLYNNKQSETLGGDIFETVSPIKPELGNSVYFDIYTGPTSVHGEDGIIKFKYSVSINEVIVKIGEGNITDKFENLN